MLPNYRRFQTGPDPFDRVWDVEFRWLQTGISIRHADTIDVKFAVWTEGEEPVERVVALRHPDLLELSKRTGVPLSDAWCLKLAALHVKRMIETGEDMDKTLVTVSFPDLETYAGELEKAAAGR
jgi:hypothetical protein